jgi:peptide/nickel transport system permease protein
MTERLIDLDATMDVGVTPEPEVVTARRPAGALLRSALRLWRTRIGLALTLTLVAIALFGPFIAPHSPTHFTGVPNTPPGGNALFGTDHIGQDVWSRFLWGGREVLAMAVASTAIGLVLGAFVGLIAAYSRSVLDDILMRTMDVILAFPQIMLALVAIATVGPKAWLIVLAVGLTTMPRVARVVRGASQPVIERDFVSAAEAIGVPRGKILLSEVLPNVLSPLMVEANLRLTYSIGLIAGLAFLGFAPNPNGADWGLMIQENQLALVVQPWGVVLPVVAIALLTIGTGLIGDGIARAAVGIDRGRGAE